MLASLDPMKVETIQGTRLLFQKNTSRIVNIQIWTDIGSSHETGEIYGVAHFLEHMFFKGTEKRDAKRINRDADLIGAKLNAWTWHDHTNYHIGVMAENFEKGFELLSDVYQNATFPPGEMEKERTVILSEMRRYDDDPSSFLSDRSVDHFCENGLAHKVIGTEETVTGLSHEQLVTFKKRFYGGENVLVAVTGGIEYEEAREMVEKYFVNLPCQKPAELAEGGYRSGHYLLKKSNLQESQYQLLYPALPYLHEKSILQSVMVAVLGGNSSAFLYERIREELGICYGIYARPYRFEGFNYIDISTGCAEKELDRVHSEVMEITRKMKEDLIEKERLEMIKASLLSSLYMSIESSHGMNSFLSQAFIKGESSDILSRRVSEIQKATREEIREMANLSFAPEPLRAELRPE